MTLHNAINKAQEARREYDLGIIEPAEFREEMHQIYQSRANSERVNELVAFAIGLIVGALGLLAFL